MLFDDIVLTLQAALRVPYKVSLLTRSITLLHETSDIGYQLQYPGTGHHKCNHTEHHCHNTHSKQQYAVRMIPVSDTESRRATTTTSIDMSLLPREKMSAGIAKNPGSSSFSVLLDPVTTKRQATYSKIIDLAHSYNIDVEKIKIEIEKIRAAKREAGSAGPTATAEANTRTNVASLDGKEDSHSTISKVTDDSEFSGEKKQGIGGVPKGQTKRFSAMNGGFNLCL